MMWWPEQWYTIAGHSRLIITYFMQTATSTHRAAANRRRNHQYCLGLKVTSKACTGSGHSLDPCQTRAAGSDVAEMTRNIIKQTRMHHACSSSLDCAATVGLGHCKWSSLQGHGKDRGPPGRARRRNAVRRATRASVEPGLGRRGESSQLMSID